LIQELAPLLLSINSKRLTLFSIRSIISTRTTLQAEVRYCIYKFIESIAKKKNAQAAAGGVMNQPKIEEEKKDDLFDSSLLTTDPSDVNNVYFKNL
jgi:hypothetical protein